MGLRDIYGDNLSLGASKEPSDVVILPRLEKLDIFRCHAVALIIEIVVSGLTKPAIKYLDMWTIDCGYLLRKMQWLADITPSVRTLRLRLGADDASRMPFAAFASCSNLHTLDLSIRSRQLELAFAIELQVFSNMVAPNIRVLRLTHSAAVAPVYGVPSTAPSWQPLVTVLSMPKFALLEELMFMFRQPSEGFHSPKPFPRGFLKEINEAFPGFSSRNVLKLP
ncbi:hypothetical protein CERSUDRAFT_71632 [Gelatoporia subvermispora B]|uniref:F-box domain-containing protein n=1 Tax=Ceriporiopsis subvermispora (strain B) TaxID=914234 RepID=M2RLN1_CERS8|nr:hypothetical protein CERSUDRAFT_71632 [Gelatoporia subvermispora B]